MTRPAKRNQKQQVFTAQKHQLWWVLAMTVLAVVCDWFLVHGLIAKSVLVGALLQFVAQSVFTLIAYRVTGAAASRQIMLNMYLGQMLKWLVTLIGFAVIFMALKPINAPLVVVAYVAMQVCHSLTMLKLR